MGHDIFSPFLKRGAHPQDEKNPPAALVRLLSPFSKGGMKDKFKY
jgi:hypothetical protein